MGMGEQDLFWFVECFLKLWGKTENTPKKGTGSRIPNHFNGYFSSYKKFDIFWKIDGLDEFSTPAKTLTLLMLGINLQVNFAYLNRDISEKDIKVSIGKS